VQCDGADKNSCTGTLFIDVEIINNLLQYFVEVNQVFLLDGGRGIARSFVSVALDRGEWSISCFSHFTHLEVPR